MQDTRAEQTYRDLRDQVLNGSLPAGAQIVTRPLAQKLGVSLAPVREAINRLAVEGLVEHIPGAGAFVRKFTRQDLDELYVLRSALECCAIGEAARFIDDDQLEDLRKICAECEEIIARIASKPSKANLMSQLDRWLVLEERFHLTIVEAARNRLLAKAISDYRAQSRIFEAQRQRPEILSVDGARETLQEHYELIDALFQRDPDRARRLMQAHLHKGRKAVLKLFRQDL